jgi:hypothetical protein
MNDDDTFRGWRKSTWSSGGDNCVEVAYATDGRVGLRDTELEGRGPLLVFTPGEWDAFLQGVKGGEFDSI